MSNDEFYTHDIVYVGSPKKWFTKTSGTRVYIKDNSNQQRLKIEENLRRLEESTESRRDRYLQKEILKKNIWKYRKEDFENKSSDRMYGK